MLDGVKRPGLLMEFYGRSLYEVLRDEKLRATSEAPESGFNDRARETVASNVASACRYLHHLGCDSSL